MKSKILLLFTTLLLTNACSKKEIRGCTDSKSTTYNVEATTDDGSCKYIADDYVGNYLATDTTTYINPNNGQLVTRNSQYSFTIAKKEATIVDITTFGYCSQSLTANVTTSSLVITDFKNCSFSSFICSKSVNTLFITYHRNAGVDETIKCKAVKIN